MNEPVAKHQSRCAHLLLTRSTHLYLSKDPKPLPDARRRVHKKPNRIEPIEPEESINRNKSSRGKPLQPIVTWSSYEENARSPLIASDDQKGSKRNRYGRKGPRMGLRAPNLRSKEEALSTRVAPLYLMQQEGDAKPDAPEEKQPEKEKDRPSDTMQDEPLDPKLLNPYALKEQFSKILSEHSDTVEFKTEVLGRTASYIDIVLFMISQKGSRYFRANEDKYVENEGKDKKIIFIVHGLSPMGLNNLFSLTVEDHLRKLVGFYLKHLDKFDIYLIPMANPDGYIQVKKQIWNKNNAPNAACPGVNVDRNFDVAWNTTSDQLSSCSQHFPGIAPFSEPESRAVRDVFHRMSHKIVAYFHVHAASYAMATFKGDAVLYPKGYTDHQTDDDKYIDLKGEIDEAIKNANFKILSVTVDTLHSWYGRVTGTSVDYAATVYGIPYAMELVMQLYQDVATGHRMGIMPQPPPIEFFALNEIWRRVIDVVFTNIYTKLEASEAARVL